MLCICVAVQTVGMSCALEHCTACEVSGLASADLPDDLLCRNQHLAPTDQQQLTITISLMLSYLLTN